LWKNSTNIAKKSGPVIVELSRELSWKKQKESQELKDKTSVSGDLEGMKARAYKA
jgi:hypothetical protein